MSLSRELARLIGDKPVSDADLKHAALFVRDTLACAVAGRDAASARMLRTIAPPASSDVARRAFLVGGLAHTLEMDDLHRDSGLAADRSDVLIAGIRDLVADTPVRQLDLMSYVEPEEPKARRLKSV